MGIDLSRRSLLAAGAAMVAAPQLLASVRLRAQEAGAAAFPLVYPRKVGELEITAVSDGYVVFSGPIFVNISEQEMAAALAAAFLDPAVPAQLGVTAHLVRTGDRTLLIDTGTADLFGPTLGRLPAALAALGVAPADVDAVLLTHMHPDHLGGLLAEGAPAFPNATVHVSEADLAFWTDEATAARAPDDFKPFFARAAATAAAYGDRVVPFGAEGEVAPGITSVAARPYRRAHRLPSELGRPGDPRLRRRRPFGCGAVRPPAGQPGLRHRPGAGGGDAGAAPRHARDRPDARRRHPSALPRHRPRRALRGRLYVGAGDLAVPVTAGPTPTVRAV
jgi:glyoxylase-like metal-dependent hydrolase (beta-lactamase superfamily II)